MKSLTIPIHSERACRENRDDKKRYRAKTPKTHLTGKSLSRKGAKAAKFEEERISLKGQIMSLGMFLTIL
jgi:hypothetical protein